MATSRMRSVGLFVASSFASLTYVAVVLARQDSYVRDGFCAGGISLVGPVYAPCTEPLAALITGVLSLIAGIVTMPWLVMPLMVAGTAMFFYGTLTLQLLIASLVRKSNEEQFSNGLAGVFSKALIAALIFASLRFCFTDAP